MKIYVPSEEIRSILGRVVERDIRLLEKYGGDIVPFVVEREFCPPMVDPPEVEITDYPKPCGEISLSNNHYCGLK